MRCMYCGCVAVAAPISSSDACSLAPNDHIMPWFIIEDFSLENKGVTIHHHEKTRVKRE